MKHLVPTIIILCATSIGLLIIVGITQISLDRIRYKSFIAIQTSVLECRNHNATVSGIMGDHVCGPIPTLEDFNHG